MYKADYHTHTEFSFDSTEPMEDQVKKAISLGFNEMAITDHHEGVVTYTDYILRTDLKDYIENFNIIKEKYRTQINIKLGAEIGYEPKGRGIIDQFTQDNPFDFIICSLHALEQEDLYFGDYFSGKTKKESYTGYFEAIKDCLNEFQNFDVFGHLDFVCRYGNYPNHDLNYLEYKDIIEDILKTLITDGKGIELNTSGLRYGVGHMHPRFDIIKRYQELGGQIITIGSDAHTAKDIGADYDNARNLLKEAGFKYFTTFTNREPEFRKL